MRGNVFACMALLSAVAGMAQTSDFLLGIDFASAPVYGSGMAPDKSGGLYFLGDCPAPSSASCVTKLAADGRTIVWQHALDGGAGAIAADPNGGVYVTTWDVNPSGVFYVEKLSADGASIVWKVPVAWGPIGILLLTVDSSGRPYVTYSELDQAYVVRVSADGSGRDYMVNWLGWPSAIAADGTGSAIVLTVVAGSDTLTRLSADGSSQLYSIAIPTDGWVSSIAADAAGNVAVLPGDALQYFNAQGEQTFSQTLPGLPFASDATNPPENYAAVAMDGVGNMYVVGPYLAHSVRNSLVACGGSSLLVYGPDGSLLQGTYLPDSTPAVFPVVATSGSVVYVIGGDNTLTRLSPNSAAQTLPLACVANAGSYFTGAVAPGEIVVLFGKGLGPQQGIITTASMQTPFPKQAGNVEVTFDGTPAPLLWVQDGQINAVAPWGLTPGQNTSVCVSYRGAKTNCLSQPVAQQSPAVFTVDGYHAVALNQDGTVNSETNPAHLNTEITFYAIGLGPINPPQADGSLVGLPLPVNAFPLGNIEPIERPDQSAESGWMSVDYAGPAPYELAGVTQINCHLNGALPPAPSTLGGNVFGIYATIP